MDFSPVNQKDGCRWGQEIPLLRVSHFFLLIKPDWTSGGPAGNHWVFMCLDGPLSSRTSQYPAVTFGERKQKKCDIVRGLLVFLAMSGWCTQTECAVMANNCHGYNYTVYTFSYIPCNNVESYQNAFDTFKCYIFLYKPVLMQFWDEHQIWFQPLISLGVHSFTWLYSAI